MATDNIKRILFVCKTNTTLSVAAEIMLRHIKPDWIVLSAASLPQYKDHITDIGIYRALILARYDIYAKTRRAISRDDMIEIMHMFDEVHDLDREGIIDPIHTGDYLAAIKDIESYIAHVVLGDK